jgi:hypothetical protein
MDGGFAMLNFRSFRTRFQDRDAEDCAFRKQASEQWQDSITAYYEAVPLLAQQCDYEAVQRSVETLRLISQEIKQILEDHEREHGCGHSAFQLSGVPGGSFSGNSYSDLK